LLSDGTITSVGSHQELLERVPEYRALLSADADLERPNFTAPAGVPSSEKVA
jgi:hypothetical protein